MESWKNSAKKSVSANLVMHEDVHDVLVDFAGQPVLGSPGEDDKLDPQQRHQYERGPHRLHVHVGLGPVGVAQFGHQHPDDVQQEEEVHLPHKSNNDDLEERLQERINLIRTREKGNREGFKSFGARPRDDTNTAFASL